MEKLLNKLNDTMERVLDKLDKQATQIAELTVKVDYYKDAHQETARKVEAVDKTTTEALQSTKAAHKRLDALEEREKETARNQAAEKKEKTEDIKKIKFAIFGMFLTIAGALIVAWFKNVFR